MPEIKVRLPDTEEQQELRALVIDGLELVGWFARLPEDETPGCRKMKQTVA